MANYANLKRSIRDVIKTNGNNEITGALLQASLISIIDSFASGYIFKGVAYPATNPGTVDQKIFYLAKEPGTYSNFGGAVIKGNLAVLYYDSTWHAVDLNILNTYMFCGVPTTSTVPLTCNWIFYLVHNSSGATQTFTNFLDSSNNPLTVSPGELCVLRKSTGGWQKLVVLTTYDAANYLSAVINNVVDVDLNGAGVQTGKYIAANGAVNSSASYNISPVISLQAGQSLCINAAGSDNVCAIAKVENGVYTKIRLYDTYGTVEAHTFYAEENINVVVSYRNNLPFAAFTYKFAEDIIDLFNDVKTIETSVATLNNEMSAIIKDITDVNLAGTGVQTGKYVNSNGVLTGSTSYNVSPVISLQAGQSLFINAAGTTAVAAISKVSNGVYTPVMTYQEYGVNEKYTYLAQENVDVVVSYRNNLPFSAFTYRFVDGITSLVEIIANQETIITEISQFLGLTKTTGFTVAVDKRYILYPSGDMVGYDSVNWEITNAIDLKAGDEIVIYTKGADNVCAIGLVFDSSNSVIPLVVGESSKLIYHYVALKDCQVRCSLNKTTTGGPTVTIFKCPAVTSVVKGLQIEDTQEYVNRVSGNQNLFVAHWAGNILGENNGTGFTIPTHSVVGMSLAKRAGFNVLGINVALTSDGVAVCIHDDTINGTMRNKSDYSVISSPVYVSQITYQDLVNNYVMQADIARYRTEILTFEDAVKTAKALGMNIYSRPANAATYTEADRILRKYGMTDYILAEGNQRKTNKQQLVAHYTTTVRNDANTVLRDMLKIGAPAVYFMEENVIESFYNNGILADVINILHKNGFLVGVSCYATPLWRYRAQQLGGFDFTSGGNCIPPFENGKLYSGSIGLNAEDFTGTTTKNLSIGQTVGKSGLAIDDDRNHIYIATIKAKIAGQFKLTFGRSFYGNETFESDGNVVSVFTNVFLNGSPDFQIEAVTACIIDELQYDVTAIF